MSVIFAAELGPITGHRVVCGCRDGAGGTFGDRADALTVLVAARETGTNLPGCIDELCAAEGPHVEAVEAEPSPEARLSSRNARYVLEALGVTEEELCGSLPGEDFLGRVLLATGLAPADAGRPATTTTGTGGGQFIDCDRPVGYLQDRLADLREVAEFAIRTGRAVTWA